MIYMKSITIVDYKIEVVTAKIGIRHQAVDSKIAIAAIRLAMVEGRSTNAVYR